jgi:hypothetical protein
LFSFSFFCSFGITWRRGVGEERGRASCLREEESARMGGASEREKRVAKKLCSFQPGAL